MAGCDLFGSDDGGGNDALIPLEEGETWTYQQTNVFDDDVEIATVQANGTGSATISSDGESSTLIVEDKENGIGMYPSNDREEEVEIRYPADPGDTYTFEAGSPDIELHTVEVSRESANVPAGSFNDCLVYEIYRGPEFDETDEPQVLYFKPGVGLIRHVEQSRPNSSGEREVETETQLTSTSVN